MKIKTYTKKNIANELSKRTGRSIRKSLSDTNELFKILKDTKGFFN